MTVHKAEVEAEAEIEAEVEAYARNVGLPCQLARVNSPKGPNVV